MTLVTVYGAGRVCRAAKATELCDDSEKCDGTSRDCPPDNLKGAGAVCRAANGPCDVEEVIATHEKKSKRELR